MYKKILAIIVLTLSLSACASSNQTKELTENIIADKPATKLYQEAYDYLQDEKFTKAAKSFEKVELDHPYSKWAIKAQLMASYAYYKDTSYDDAIISLKRYIKLHPKGKDTAYAHYLLAMSYYNQIQDVRRDQEITQNAFNALDELIKKFPNSSYADDALAKIDLTKDHLAGKEMSIGRYYLKQQKYQAAINRFNNVVTKYNTTSHIPEALYRLTEAYTILGLHQIAEENAAVLGHNYPSNKWYKKAFGIVEKGQITKVK